jgi:uncharacterized membrane protein YfcA
MASFLLVGCVVGLALGLTGGGGSILAIPLLLYWVHLPFGEAKMISLAAVGLTSLVGAILQSRLGVVRWRAGAMLGLGGVLAAPVGILWGHALDPQWNLGLFSALMVIVALRMWRGGMDLPLGRWACPRNEQGLPIPTLSCAGKIMAAGSLAGVLAGMFGVGGGFLVVPALQIVTGMGMERVASTSLVAISVISGAAFLFGLGAGGAVDPASLGIFCAGGGAGIALGIWGKKLCSPLILSRLFASLSFLAASYIFFQVFLAGKQ